MDRPIALARQAEEADVKNAQDDLSPLAMTLVSEQGGAFDWLAEEPDLFSVDTSSLNRKETSVNSVTPDGEANEIVYVLIGL